MHSRIRIVAHTGHALDQRLRRAIWRIFLVMVTRQARPSQPSASRSGCSG
jgi:hypothetical protein